MLLVNKAVHVIDREGNQISLRNPTDQFMDYLQGLVRYVSENDTVRNYRSRSIHTQVIGSVIDIVEHVEDQALFSALSESVANRLLRVEIETQRLVERLQVNVRKGTLIQALLFDPERATYIYLLAKVEHSEFVDETDFSFKNGFYKDKKTIWKSCTIELTQEIPETLYARVYTDTTAGYWSDSFLELDALSTNEDNTSRAFRSIEVALGQNLKRDCPQDYTYLRNGFITYFKSHEQITYREMVHELVEQFNFTQLTDDKKTNLIRKLLELPTTKNFEQQFLSVPSVVIARKTTYEVNTGIQIQIAGDIQDIQNTIFSNEDENGEKFIHIRTDNDDLYRSFLRNP